MNRLDLSYLGGMPLTQADIQWLQNSYISSLTAIAKMIGDKVIVSGMVESGGNVSDGWIIIDGEPIPFVNGAIGTGKFTIQQTSDSRVFHDGNLKPVRISRVAVFSITGAYNYSDLKRIGTLKNMWCLGDQKSVHCNAAYIAASFDSTGKGIAGTEREGWAICNGNNGTEDLRGYFLVGYDNRPENPGNNVWDVLYNTIGAAGGEKKHQLTPNEFSHGHTVPRGDSYNGDGQETDGRTGGGQGSNPQTPVYTSIIGNGTGIIDAHENRPPFKVKLFIEKIA